MNQEPMDWQKKKFSSMEASEQYLATSNIIREDSNVNSLYMGAAERAINALFLMNSGGAITVLAYIYHASVPSAKLFLSISLVTFLLGVALVFNVVARDFYYIRNKSLEFKNDIQSFLLGKIPFSDIKRFQMQQPLDKAPTITLLCGNISAYCTIVGIFFGLLGYFFS